jgi:ATP-binding cassette, subfamily B, bacterial PglK
MNRQNWFVVKFQKSMKLLSKTEIFRETISQSVRPIMESIAVIGMLFIVLFLLQQGHSIGILASILALFALAIQRLLPAINSIVGEYNKLRYHVYSVKPVYEDIINFRKYSKENKKENIEKTTLKDKIELKNISYTYPESKEEVLKNISLSIPKEKAVGFVGATGSGKTTLIDLILGLLEPTKGNILVDGKDIRNNLKAWHKNIGYIPQFIYLSDDTIANNIAFGLTEKEIDQEKLKEAIEASQLDEFVKRLPNGLDTFIGERGIRLSGGQRQRVGIARALYNNPEILVMDEATSSLDNITEKFVIQAIENLKKERTVIIIAHRLTTVKNCDKLYLIKDGRIIDEGTYEELLKNNGDFKLMADHGE